MRGKFVKGMMAGSLMGAALGLMIIPSMDGKTRRRMKRRSRAAMNAAEDAYGTMMNWIK
ncbi:MAG: YtxH domain-containing protein [Bacillota bacterium]|nr:YtxH domain-containing protein [Bacillota bacterium]